MDYLKTLTDQQLQSIRTRGVIPMELVDQELVRRQHLRFVAEGADSTNPTNMGLGGVR